MNKTILLQKVSKKIAAGLIFGVAAVAGIAITLAFTEPTSGPTGFNEPATFREKGTALYPGRGWLANASGDGSTALTKTACEAAYAVNDYYWQWFEDGNGDGDQIDGEDGMCVLMGTGSGTVNTANYSNDGYLSASWNGAEQISGATLSVQTATDGSTNSVTKSGAGWTANAYQYSIAQIKSGSANGCWGIIKSNTTDTITVYGSWLTNGATYTACASSSASDDTFQIYGDNMYDNSWIGDWTCSGNFPTGTTTYGFYPTSVKVGANLIALATTDCLDGKRDLLPNESDRAVITGTATAGTAGTALEDTALTLDTNAWIGQMIKITSGASINSISTIESNTANTFTVSGWSAGAPSAGDTYQVIYIIPFAGYQLNTSLCGSTSCTKNNNGPLTAKQLAEWKGVKLPTSQDFFGFCGDGASYKPTGTYGSQLGRTDEYVNEADDSVYEWLSEPHASNYARIAGVYGCSYFVINYVFNSNRFRAVFRP